MWKPKVQSTSSGSKTSGSKTSGQTKSTNLQHLSPFASHPSQEPMASPSLTSPKTATELPSGVRYIRQTPSSLYRPITGRPIASNVTKRRDKSPEKNLRFADPIQCSRKHEKIINPTTIPIATKPTARTRSTSMDRNLVRPVISAEPSPTECKRFSSHNQKVVATSPATRQTSPIFSTVDFGGDSNRNSTSRRSPSTETIPKTRNNVIPVNSHFNNGISMANHRPTLDRPPVIKTEISTPTGTVLKRSTSVTSKVENNGNSIHRNAVSFPIPSTNEHNSEQSRLSVNVNVAVGLDCNDNRMFDRRYTNLLEPELDRNVYIGEDLATDEVDWMPGIDKGFALKVAVRLRPFIQSEIVSKNNISVIEMNGNTVRIINSDNDNYNRVEYGFDVCLNSSDRDLFDFSDQDSVFKKMGEPLLERALEGYNVCLFAYGQTGSGKSFTMSGTDHNPGIIPRFVHELFRRMNNLTEVLFAVEVSYYEIYNEKIYDLLSDDKDYNKKILRIREHPQTGPYVEHLSQHTVDTEEELIHLLRSGSKRRATASTAANNDSSRSHSIFTIILTQLKNNSDENGLDMSCSCGSRINLIDLAGSERVGHSGTSGDRLKEGSLINKSLLNLGKVISKLAEYSANPTKTAHIPYRDSALTWLLKESLGGNSQTSMIATISPAKCHLEETMSTLRYAATARRIVNFVHINEDPKTKKIRELMEIIAQLRAKQRTEAIDAKDVDLQKDSPTSSAKSTSNDSNNSFDSQTLEEKKVEKKSIATNTSFVMDSKTSTKGEDKKKEKSTASIATNTSFIKPPETWSISTEPQPIKSAPKPKPKKLVSTATETSFVEPLHVDTSTNTSFVELPSRLDLLRFKKLEEQEKQLLEDIRKHKDKLVQELSRKVEDWAPIGSHTSDSDIPPKSDTFPTGEDEWGSDNALKDDTPPIGEDVCGSGVAPTGDDDWGSDNAPKEETPPIGEDVWDTAAAASKCDTTPNDGDNWDSDTTTKGDTVPAHDNNWDSSTAPNGDDNWDTVPKDEEQSTVPTGDDEWGSDVAPKCDTVPTGDEWGLDTAPKDEENWDSDTLTKGDTAPTGEEDWGSETVPKEVSTFGDNEWETDAAPTAEDDWDTGEAQQNDSAPIDDDNWESDTVPKDDTVATVDDIWDTTANVNTDPTVGDIWGSETASNDNYFDAEDVDKKSDKDSDDIW